MTSLHIIVLFRKNTILFGDSDGWHPNLQVNDSCLGVVSCGRAEQEPSYDIAVERGLKREKAPKKSRRGAGSAN